MIAQEFAESPEGLREEIADLREKLEAARAELQRLQSSPAPVVGGMPELTETEIEWLRCVEHALDKSPSMFDGYLPEGVSANDASIALDCAILRASRLSSIKPWSVVVDREEWEETCCEISAWRDATKANERTKALHISEYHLLLTIANEDGDAAPWRVPVPWTVIKDIMEAIRADASRRRHESRQQATPHKCTREMCDEIDHPRDDVIVKLRCRVCGKESEHEVPE